jgi:hypothetical protein
MLDKLITYIVCLYKTLYQVMPVVCTNRITTRRDTHSDTGSHNRLDLIHSKINKFVQYSEGDYNLCMTSRLFVAIHSIAFFMLLTLMCFTRIPIIWCHDKLVWHWRSRATSLHSFITSVVIQHLVSDTLYQTGYFL